MVALERRAGLRETLSGNAVGIKSQPFGGAIQILDLSPLRDLIGDFHFDSERSQALRDFRLFIRPSSWPALREFCQYHVNRDKDPTLEAEPSRELAEEFADALKIDLAPGQYTCVPLGTFDESSAAPTENIRAKGYPTVRIYRVFEASITDSSLAETMLENSRTTSDQSLSGLALNDARNGGPGRASAVLALPWKQLQAMYQAMLPDERNAAILFRTDLLDSTVSLILDGISGPKYRRL